MEKNYHGNPVEGIDQYGVIGEIPPFAIPIRVIESPATVASTD